MTDDGPPTIDVDDLGDDAFAVLVIRPAEEPSSAVADPGRGAEEPSLLRVLREVSIEARKGVAVGRGDRPDLDRRWWRRIGHGHRFAERSSAHQVRTARIRHPSGRCFEFDARAIIRLKECGH